jgi:hypothetical protein
MAHAAFNEVCTHPDPDLTTALERLPQAATLTALVVAFERLHNIRQRVTIEE